MNRASMKRSDRGAYQQAMSEKTTIMIVDDNPDMITVMKTVLEVRGYGVVSASDGEQFFDRLAENKPDLILLDVMMPLMNGLEVLKRLRANPETSSIPVMLVTAKVQYQDVLAGYKQGADYYLTKPFTSSQLLNGINILLKDGIPDSKVDRA
jgi:CheY-like chemotaxis protein